VVLEAAPTPASIEARSDEGRSQLCLISARTPEALRAQISRLTDWIDAHPEASLADVCQTLNAGRSHFGFRLALITGSLAELRHKLTTAEPPALSVYDANVSDVAPDFVLPGRGQLAADSTEERSAMLENLARLYEAGAEIDWRNFHSDGRRGVVALPSYPFEHEECRASRQAAAAQEPVWPLVEAAARLQAMQCPLDLDWASYPTRWAVLDRYTTRAMTATLRALGVFGVAGERHTAESLALKGGVIPAHLRLLARWLDRLADAGFLRRVPAGDFECVAALSGDVARPFEPEERDLFAKEWGLLEYVESSGIQAAAILRGDASAIEPLFAGGSFARAESIYEHSPLARYCNGIVRAAVQTFAQMHRGALRVLEIGAGTGATTASVLPALPAERAIYTYTDVSEAFLTNARKRFGAAYPMEFAILDLDRPPVEQGFAKHDYDIVLATNAVHATVNCDRSLAHIRSLLRPGGLVVLSELTQVRSWFDISSGFIEGWRKGDDKRRGDGPLLGKAGWIEALTDAGFPHIAALPEDGEFAGIVGQHVFVAGLPGGNVTPPVFVRADHAGAAPPATAEAACADTGEVFAAKLRTASATQRRTLLIEFLSAMLSRILQLDPSRLDRRQRLVDLGIDSLLALEFRDLLAQELKTEGRLSATLVFDYPTIEALAAHLETNFANEDREAAKHDELNAAAGSLEKLSEEEAGLLLASSLKALYK
jgi:SAM-dependent methyltransferase/acyl carrier protein